MSETAKKITKKELQDEIVKLKADLDLYKSKTQLARNCQILEKELHDLKLKFKYQRKQWLLAQDVDTSEDEV